MTTYGCDACGAITLAGDLTPESCDYCGEVGSVHKVTDDVTSGDSWPYDPQAGW
jgi:hypothetical protein